MKFSELLTEIRATYRDHSPAFHVLATRYYIGADSLADLRRHANPSIITTNCELAPAITQAEVDMIITNR